MEWRRGPRPRRRGALFVRHTRTLREPSDRYSGVFNRGAIHVRDNDADDQFAARRVPGDGFVVGLAAQNNYITVFVTAVEDGAYLAERAGRRLGKVRVGRSSISLKRLSDVDLPVLLEIVQRANLLMPGS